MSGQGSNLTVVQVIKQIKDIQCLEGISEFLRLSKIVTEHDKNLNADKEKNPITPARYDQLIELYAAVGDKACELGHSKRPYTSKEYNILENMHMVAAGNIAFFSYKNNKKEPAKNAIKVYFKTLKEVEEGKRFICPAALDLKSKITKLRAVIARKEIEMEQERARAADDCRMRIDQFQTELACIWRRYQKGGDPTQDYNNALRTFKETCPKVFGSHQEAEMLVFMSLISFCEAPAIKDNNLLKQTVKDMLDKYSVLHSEIDVETRPMLEKKFEKYVNNWKEWFEETKGGTVLSQGPAGSFAYYEALVGKSKKKAVPLSSDDYYSALFHVGWS